MPLELDPGLISSLSKIPLFYGLETNELKLVLSLCKSDSYTTGTEIFNEGDPSHSMYILLSGEVDILTHKKGIIFTLHSCDIFGEIGLLTQRTRSASAITKSDCKLLRIDHVEFNLLAGKQPRISAILMKNIGTNLANHVLRMNNAKPLEHIPQTEKRPVSAPGSQILKKIT